MPNRCHLLTDEQINGLAEPVTELEAQKGLEPWTIFTFLISEGGKEERKESVRHQNNQ